MKGVFLNSHFRWYGSIFHEFFGIFFSFYPRHLVPPSFFYTVGFFNVSFNMSIKTGKAKIFDFEQMPPLTSAKLEHALPR
jgi:hypothetical protein